MRIINQPPLKTAHLKKIRYKRAYRTISEEQKSVSGFEIQWSKVHFTSQFSTSSVVIDLRN
jgi:hypothetical protein